MTLLKIGPYHINTDRLVNVVTPARRQHADRSRPDQGMSNTAAVVVLAGSDDLVLFDEDADAMRAWLAGQAAPKPTVAPIATKATTPTTK